MDTTRSVVLVLLAFLLVGTSSVALADEPTAGGGAGGSVSFAPESISLGVGPAFFTGNGPTALKLQAGVTLELLPPVSSAVDVDLLLPLGFGYASESINFAGMVSSYTTFWFEFIPSVEVVYAATSALSLYGDGGLGFALFHVSVDAPLSGNVSDTDVAFALRFSAGARLAVSDSIALFAEPLGISVYTRSGSEGVFTMLFGALLKI